MESLTTAISVQVNKEDKEQATKILQKLGVSMSGLINMMLKQVILRKSIPFDISLPKEEDNLHKYFSEEELEETAKELAYIKTHLKEYKKNNNWNDLKKELFPNDEV